MADHGSLGFGPQLDIEELLSEAQHRWLRPAEICEILRNYQKFHISSEPPNRPPSGSLFLFDRKVLRYFRKDGHNWRKKKDGKTVKEAHEKLKVGSVDVLHCYYAHGEENENLQRRSYWMLEPDLMHIVFVHYLEVKGNRMGTGVIRETSGVISNSVNGSTSGNIDSTTSPTSTWSSSCEDADSGDSHQTSLSLQAFPAPEMGTAKIMDNHTGFMNPYYVASLSENHEGWSSVPGVDNISQVHGNMVRESDLQRPVNLADWGGVLEQTMSVYNNLVYPAPLTQTQPAITGMLTIQENAVKSDLLAADNVVTEQLGNPLPIQPNWQVPFGDIAFESSKWPMGLVSDSGITTDDLDLRLLERKTHDEFVQPDLQTCSPLNHRRQEPTRDNLQAQFSTAESECMPNLSSCCDAYGEGNMNHTLPVRKSLLDAEESLKKVDSFSRWITKQLGEVDLQMQSSSGGIAWSSVDCETEADGSSLSPSLSQDQRFTIIDFSPKWSYTDSEVEVMVIGNFLMSKQEITKCNWSCMFGEVEVPAEILVDGTLCCHAPPHTVGQVPFYVTCSNRFACSEVREFDYRLGSTKSINSADVYGVSAYEAQLHSRLEMLISQRSSSHVNHIFEGVREKQKLISKIMLLKEEKESQLPCTALAANVSKHEEQEQAFWDMLQEKLYSWLIHKVTEDGKGPTILDEDGRGVLHYAAALGYDWAIKPILAAGVSINFRDVNGWTALHWAAFCGREQTVAVLVSLDADTGALTDPSPEFPLGRTPADLASGKGHKGISGFLAESSLTSYLEKITMKESKEHSSTDTPGTKAVQTVSGRTATPVCYGDVPDALSLKDSLAAVCNATQAADRIHQVFRMQSFQWKQQSQCDVSDECAISVVAAKTGKPGQNDFVHAAAVHIQKKYRGWKKRKEFLLIRQRIVKLQAHVRGHQVRKQYRAIVWSVGILEKVILRWRRKSSGLRGFKREAITKQSEQPESTASEDDDFDFLKQGRKQTEERLQKALTRVKSMVQYPEARAQYRRLLTVVEGIREHEASISGMNSADAANDGDEEDLIEIDSLFDDDTLMSITFE